MFVFTVMPVTGERVRDRGVLEGETERQRDRETVPDSKMLLYIVYMFAIGREREKKEEREQTHKHTHTHTNTHTQPVGTSPYRNQPNTLTHTITVFYDWINTKIKSITQLSKPSLKEQNNGSDLHH